MAEIKLKENKDGTHKAVTWDIYGGMFEFQLKEFEEAVSAMFAKRKTMMPLHDQKTHEATEQIKQARAALREAETNAKIEQTKRESAEQQSAQKDIQLQVVIDEKQIIRTILTKVSSFLDFKNINEKQYELIKRYILEWEPGEYKIGDIRVDPNDDNVYKASQNISKEEKLPPSKVKTSWDIVPVNFVPEDYKPDVDYYLGDTVLHQEKIWQPTKNKPQGPPAATNEDWVQV